MVPTDARSSWSWTGGVLSDGRVVHFWDENKTIGKWYAQYDVDYADNGVVWDAYYLYGPEAQWGSTPPKPIVMGATVIDKFDELKNAVAPLTN